MKQTYHTNLIIAYQMGILEPEIVSRIPRSTRYYFKKNTLEHLVGNEYSFLTTEKMDLLLEIFRWKRLFRVCTALIKIKNTIIKKDSCSENKLRNISEIVNTVNKTKDILGFDRALRYFNISRNQFYSWSNQVKHSCTESFSGLCIKRWPNQLSVKTVNTIQQILNDTFFNGWPIASIAYFAARTKKLHLSLGTWYKYARILNHNRNVPRCNKKRRVGIRTDEPNKIWHADVTLFRTTDNIRSYIYLVVDNFSRKILSWQVSPILSGEIRRDTIREAFENFVTPSQPKHSIDLLVDDGSENNNRHIDTFLSGEEISIRKLIAQKDIIFSNSIIEAVNKIVKYRHLFLHNIESIEQLRNHLNYFIPIYNSVRPHVSLKGLTPDEAFSGITLNKRELKKQAQLSRAAMVKENQSSACTVCSE